MKILQPKKDPKKILTDQEQISQGIYIIVYILLLVFIISCVYTYSCTINSHIYSYLLCCCMTSHILTCTLVGIVNQLPFVVAFFSINVPAGLSLYWIINNLLTTAITTVVKQRFANEPVPIEVTKMMATIEGGAGAAALKNRSKGPSAAVSELRGNNQADNETSNKSSGFGSKSTSDFESAATSTFAAAAAATSVTPSTEDATAAATDISSGRSSDTESGSSKRAKGKKAKADKRRK